MKIGVPKELKHNEARVGINPAGIELLVKAGHCVYVQKDAGVVIVAALRTHQGNING